MSQKKSDLSTRQLKAIESLLSGASNQRAAELAGVTTRTLERWLQDPDFNNELGRRFEFALRRAAVRLTALLDVAANVFYQGMTDPDRQTGIKLRAANSVFAHLPKLIETTEILRRLDELEQRIKHET
jgi:hypothetical protein